MPHQAVAAMADDNQVGTPFFRLDDDAFGRMPDNHLAINVQAQSRGLRLEGFQHMVEMLAGILQDRLGFNVLAKLRRTGDR